jgi:Fur family ferric uptake transcriptional regulator
MTAQRRIVARVLSMSHDHPDIDELHRRARRIDPQIALSTIYRIVRLFCGIGIVEKHNFTGGRARLEPAPNEHHDHLIDIGSGRAIEFRSDEIEHLLAEIASHLGYQIVEHRLELYGVQIENIEGHRSLRQVKASPSEASHASKAKRRDSVRRASRPRSSTSWRRSRRACMPRGRRRLKTQCASGWERQLRSVHPRHRHRAPARRHVARHTKSRNPPELGWLPCSTPGTDLTPPLQGGVFANDHALSLSGCLGGGDFVLPEKDPCTLNASVPTYQPFSSKRMMPKQRE